MANSYIFACVLFLSAIYCASSENDSPGTEPPVPNIIAGQDASPGQFPYQISLQLYYGGNIGWFHMCGGSILNHRYVVTAAHCVYDEDNKLYAPANLSVVAGSIFWMAGDRHSVSRLIPNSQYNFRTHENDIALVRRYVYSPAIQPVTLDSEYIGADIPVTLSGWGKTTNETNTLAIPFNLKYLNTMTYDCESYPGQLCTFYSGHGACSGDSGGPLVLNGTKMLVGVASLVVPGSGDCGSGNPNYFTRISYYYDWIQSHAV